MAESIARKAIGGTLWNIAAQMVSLAVSFGSVFLLARWLGPQDYGLLPMVNSIIAFILIFADFGISSSASRYVAQFGTTDRIKGARIVRDGLLAVLITCALFTFICMASGKFVVTIFKEPKLQVLMPMAAVLLFGRTMIRYLIRITQGFHDLKIAAWYSMITETLIGLLALAAVLLGGGVAEALWGRAGGAWIGTAVVAFYVYRRYLRGIASQGDSYLSRVFQYGLPLLLTTASYFIYVQSAALLIGYFLDSAQVAFFNVPQALIQKLQLPATAIGSALGPLFGTLFNTCEKVKIERLFRYATKYIFLLYVPVTAALILLAEPIVLLLLGEEYRPAIAILKIYSPFLFFFSLSSVISPIFDYSGRARYRAALVLSSALLNVLISVIVIPLYGIKGAAWCSLGTYAPAMTILFLEAGRWCGFRLRSQVYTFTAILTATFAVCGLIIIAKPITYGWFGMIGTVLGVVAVYSGLVIGLKVITPNELKIMILKRGRGIMSLP